MKNGRHYMLLAAVILILALGFRFYSLERKAVHHDESVNYAFTKKLADRFFYHYNPTAYHGPFLYFAAVPVYKLMGPTKFSLRMTECVFGIMAVLFLLLMRKSIGDKGALIAALIMALSPVDVYFSRTFIHEIFLSTFFMAMLASFLSYIHKPKIVHFFIFFICLAFCFTVKETAALMTVSFVGAYLGTRLYFRGIIEPTDADDRMKIDWSHIRQNKYFFLDGIALGIAVLILLFTSFLTYPHGILKFFEAYMPWMNTGFKDTGGHVKPFYYFFEMLGKYYMPIIVPAVITGLWSLGKQKPRGIFLFLLAMFQLILYSAIPYKTPWCVMQIGLPFCVLAGYGLSKALNPDNVPRIVRAHIGIFLLILTLPYAWMSYVINFVEYDNDKYKIVYVQTDRSYEDMFRLLKKMADRSGLGLDVPIAVVDAKNPSRFYLHPYKEIKYVYDADKAPTDRPVLFVDSTLTDDVLERLPKEYIKLRYPVWPGTYTDLLVETDFYTKYAKEGT